MSSPIVSTLAEKPLPKKYTSGVRIGTDYGFMHMTTGFHGVLTDSELDVLQKEMTKLFGQVKGSTISIVGEDKYGPNKDIPVLLLKPEGECMEVVHGFYTKHGVKDSWMKEKPESHNYHVSARNDKLRALLKEEGSFVVTNWFVKQLGPHDPCLYLE
jgi:hypothetical protein